MHLKFTKMHGCGNDYIYFECGTQRVYDPETLALILSDRHFGIGGDGIVLICPSNAADAEMRMFNADGSEGNMCGNAIRCVGKYLYDHGMTQKTEVDIATRSGIKHLTLFPENGKVTAVRVDMGRADLSPAAIPALLDGARAVNVPLEVGGKTYPVTCVSMGNPHCVLFTDEWENFDLNHADIEPLGRQFENAPVFPARVNTEFIKILNGHELQMRVWERGSGETFACGTGACAAVVAAVENGHFKKGQDVTVHLRGGELIINYTDERVLMTGPAEEVFTGTIDR